jgi:Ulp1 family protease
MSSAMPRQSNGVDCGVYVLCVAELIVASIVEVVCSESGRVMLAGEKMTVLDASMVASAALKAMERVRGCLKSTVNELAVARKRRDLFLKVLELRDE